MPTKIIKIVNPDGTGDYTTISSALAAIPADLTSVDEQWDIVIRSKIGGYQEKVVIPNVTTSSSCYISLYPYTGDEYNPLTDEGVKIIFSTNYSQVVGGNTPYTEIRNIYVENTGNASARAIYFYGKNHKILGCTARSNSINIWSKSTNCEVKGNLSLGGTTGVSLDSWGSGEVDNNTAIDCVVGFSKPNNSNGTGYKLRNNLYVGSGQFTNRSGWNATFCDYNASTDNTAVGSNSHNNISTDELVDYNNGDYRLNSGSTLATSGDAGIFIGYSLEESVQLRQPFSTSNSLIWNIFNSLVSQNNISSDIKQYLVSPNTINWNILSPFNFSEDVSWNIKSPLQSSESVSWGILGGLIHPFNLAWSITSGIVSPANISWNVRGNLTSTSNLNWSIKNNISSSSNLIWNITSGLQAPLGFSWDIRNSVNSLSNIQWNIFEGFEETTDIKWKINPRDNISSTSEFTWNILGDLQSLSEVSWRIEGLDKMYPSPDERCFVINYQDRNFSIQKESREFLMPKYSREYMVEI